MSRESAIRGSVRSEDGPFEGAYLSLKGGSGEFVGEIRTDETGRFQFYAGPGDWTVTCLVPGRGTPQTRVWHVPRHPRGPAGPEPGMEFQV